MFLKNGPLFNFFKHWFSKFHLNIILPPNDYIIIPTCDKTDQSPSSTSEVKKPWIFTSTPHISFYRIVPRHIVSYTCSMMWHAPQNMRMLQAWLWRHVDVFKEVINSRKKDCFPSAAVSRSLPTHTHLPPRKKGRFRRSRSKLRKANIYQSLRQFCLLISKFYVRTRPRGGAVSWGTALQAVKSRVRFPMVSLQFFIVIILSVAL
jgi:hypothetical protein